MGEAEFQEVDIEEPKGRSDSMHGVTDILEIYEDVVVYDFAHTAFEQLRLEDGVTY